MLWLSGRWRGSTRGGSVALATLLLLSLISRLPNRFRGRRAAIVSTPLGSTSGAGGGHDPPLGPGLPTPRRPPPAVDGRFAVSDEDARSEGIPVTKALPLKNALSKKPYA